MTDLRHSWRQPVRFPHKTERECSRCGLIRVTRHDAGESAIPWVEFWKEGSRLDVRGTPTCEPAEQVVA
jgi:hypothetical protein